MLRLICTEDGANKFWEGGVEGSTLTVRFGKVGTAGQTKVKELASPAAAAKELDKVVAEKRKKGYVDDGGAAAPAGRAPMRMYGMRPGDWGEDTEHPFEVKFAAPPSAADKAKIARLFETKLAKGDADPCARAWLWSGPWALLFVGEREADDERTATERTVAAVAAVGKAFQAIDKEVPVAELLFLGLIALHHTEKITVPASDGPDWGDDYGAADRAYGRKCVDPEDAAVFDPEFEALRAKAAGRKIKAAVASGLAFSPAPRGSKPPQPSAAVVKAFGPGFRAYYSRQAAGQAVAVINRRLWVLAEGEEQARAVELPGQSGGIDDLTLRLDGKAARFNAVITDTAESKKYGGLARWFEVALPAGTARKLPYPPFNKSPPHPKYVRDGLILYFCGQQLILCGPDGQTELASLTFEGGGPYGPLVCLGGRAVIFPLDTKTELVCAVAIGKDRLVEVGRSDRIRCDSPFERDGRVFAGGQELTNLRELVDAAIGPG